MPRRRSKQLKKSCARVARNDPGSAQIYAQRPHLVMQRKNISFRRVLCILRQALRQLHKVPGLRGGSESLLLQTRQTETVRTVVVVVVNKCVAERKRFLKGVCAKNTVHSNGGPAVTRCGGGDLGTCQKQNSLLPHSILYPARSKKKSFMCKTSTPTDQP